MDLKQPKLIEEQIQTLKEHRMIIEDEENDSLFAYMVILLKRLPNKKYRELFIDEVCDLIRNFENKVDMNLIGLPMNYKDIFDRNRR